MAVCISYASFSFRLYRCGNCADVCPAKVKALEMKPLATQMQEIDHWEYAQHKVTIKII